MRFVALACAFTLLAACGQPADKDRQAAADKGAGSSEVASSTIAAAAARPLSKEAALKLMHQRHENMEKIGDANKALRRQITAPSPDLAAIRASAATIARLAPRVPSWFPTGTGPDVGKTEAKAEIWRNPKDFAARSKAFRDAAVALDAAAKAGDLAAVKARFADLGKTCKACHDPYREEDH